MNRYDNPTILTTQLNKPYWKTKGYPNIPVSEFDVYVITTVGDRLDSLAYQFYRDATLWWVISIANTDQLPQNSLVIPEGLQIRIPAFYAGIINTFNRINS